jgi:hypothetical protein
MPDFCHRCGDELSAVDGISPFCPHCGSPQLYLQDYEEQPGLPASDTTGAPPPPHVERIDWKAAVQSAAIVALVASILVLVSARIQAVTALSWLWTVSGSLITLALYQRRRPLAWMDAGVGARIGVVVGLALIACFGIAFGAGGLVARFGLHNMASFDAEIAQLLQAQIQKASATAPATPELIGFLNAPEVKAGMMLAGLAMFSGVVMLLSTIGGALGGFLRMRRKFVA